MNPKFSVLIIEDETHILNFMRKILTSHDYKVLSANTGKAGLEIISSQCPDIILLDLGLPDIDGVDIIKKVREWSSCPIIVISARTSEREKVLALDLGADDYITKPFNAKNLELLVQNIQKSRKQNIEHFKQAEELNIRDGCCFGPVLIMNGEINMEAYNKVSGLNPRTAIGQRADGAVVFVCIDGRQPSSMGGEYADVIDIMVEYGAVNACNMDGGSSTVMLYRDTYGIYGEAGEVHMMNSYSLLQSEPRKMPDFWMVRPAEEE